MRRYQIVVGVDGSPSGHRALSWAADQARVHKGSIRAVMVYDWMKAQSALLGGRSPVEEQRRVEDYLTSTLTDVRREFPDVPIVAETLSGSAGRTLAEAAGTAELLVVGSRGHGRLHHAVLGSVSEACVRLATCPVVIIPAPVYAREPAAKGAERTGQAEVA